MQDTNVKALKIKILLLDVDGVLTDGKLFFGNNGEELKAFNIKDGLGIKLLQKNGIQVGIITGRTSQLVMNRSNDLGIKIIIQGREDKLQAINELISEHNLSLDQVAYMGDDLPDLSAIKQVGLGMTVANACKPVMDSADWISSFDGGAGAVREACELILQAQGKLEKIIVAYGQ